MAIKKLVKLDHQDPTINRVQRHVEDVLNSITQVVTPLASTAAQSTASLDALSAFTASVATFTASFNAFSASVNNLSASVNAFTASHNTFSASVNIFTASIAALSRTFAPLSATVAFWGATGSLSGASQFRVQQINATSFNFGVSANKLVADANVPFQIDAPGVGPGYYGANKNGAYGMLFGYDGGFGGGVVRQVTSDPLLFIMNSNTIAGTVNSAAEWHFKNNAYVTGTLKTSANVFLSGGLLHVNSATSTTLLNLSVGTPTQQALIQFISQSAVKYQFGKDGADNLYAYDIQNNVGIWSYSSSSRVITFTAQAAADLRWSNNFRQQVIKGYLPTANLTGSIASQTVMASMNGQNVPTYFVAPYAGSVSALTAKVYNAVATAGALTGSVSRNGVSIAGLAANWTATQLNNTVATTFTPGTYTFAAGDQLTFQVVSNTFAQAGGLANGVEFAMFVLM